MATLNNTLTRQPRAHRVLGKLERQRQPKPPPPPSILASTGYHGIERLSIATTSQERYPMIQAPTAPHFGTANILPSSPLERIGETPAKCKTALPSKHISMAKMMERQSKLMGIVATNKSMMYCGKYASKVNPMQNSVNLTIYKNKKYSVSGCVQTCKNKYCLACGGRRQREFIDKLQGFVLKAKNNRMDVYFITYTKNKDPSIENSMKAAREGFSQLTKKCNDLQRTYGDVAIVGNIEASFGREAEYVDGSFAKLVHVHFHGLLALPEGTKIKLDKIKGALDKAWEKGVRKEGGWVFTEEHLKDKVSRWIPISSEHGVRELGKYITKELSGKYEDVALGQELTSMMKDMGGRGLHALLKDICIYDDPADVSMYLEFMKAVSGMKTLRSNRTYSRIARDGMAIIERMKVDPPRWTEDAVKRCAKDVANRWECQDIDAVYTLRTSQNEAISRLKREGGYAEQGKALNAQIDSLLSDIRGYEKLLIEDNWYKLFEELKMNAERKAKYQDRVAGEVKVSPSIWNAIAMRHNATFQFIEFYTQHYTEGLHNDIALGLTEWLQANIEYHTEDPQKANTRVMEELDVWIWSIKKRLES